MSDGHSRDRGRDLAVVQPSTIDHESYSRIVFDEIKFNLRGARRKIDIKTRVRRELQIVAIERWIYRTAGRHHVQVAKAEQNIEIEAAVREQSRRRVTAARR